MNLFSVASLLILGLGCGACGTIASSSASSAGAAASHPPAGPRMSGKTWSDETFGLHFESLRVSGDGLLLDLRYRVTDADKALHVVNRKTRPVIIDPASKMELQVPHAKNIGTLRQTGTKLIEGRSYSALFANPGRIVKSGNKVNIVMGAFRLDDVVVE